MKNIYSFLGIAFLLIGLTACNKYEFGPDVSLRTKKGRLTNEWELKDVVVNRMDTLSEFNATELTFDKDDNLSMKTTYTNTSIGDSVVTIEGEWTFDNDGLSIVAIFTDDNGHKDALLYDIVKLTKDELWLSEILGTDEYIYYFEEIQ